ncbi:MAG: flagellar filament capping protein FliD [Oscillospiraceae bacterium]|jgi:flagellar capping protein FliD|nr:flagellar filament capping protein FliD [Oscillospiraceae bacterium]MCI1990112.1 flagellar filament capping protein FliD [Oscillospiraceae bacterium]MCI2034491.1 flagellar filament capping protein FliD [Oscillospiraceae bacterium]
MSTSPSSSTSIASFYSSGGVLRMNGSEFASGLDTQNLIKALTAKTQSKIDKQGQLKQIAQWKKQMYQDVEDLLQSFSDNYFSYAMADTNIMSSTFFDSGALVSSNDGVASATGSAQNAGNVVINSITSLATSASLTSNDPITAENITSGTIRNTWEQSSVGGKSIVVNYGGKDYTLTLSNSVALDNSASVTDNLAKIADGLNKQIQSTSGLNGKMSFSASDGHLELKLTASSDTAAIKAYKADDTDTSGAEFLADLGFSSAGMATIEGAAVGNTVSDQSAFFTTVNLGDTLAGSTVTFQLDGVSKTVTFNQSEEASYYNPANTDEENAALLASYLGEKLDAAYGSGKINVDGSSGKLVFTTADSTSVLAVASSSASNVLGADGALRIGMGETNRLETSKTLKDLASELNTPFTASYTDENGVAYYSLAINGKTFTFDENTELNTVINTINSDPDVGVNLSYSQTLNKFRITADDTGAQGKISIAYGDVLGSSSLTGNGTGTTVATGDLGTGSISTGTSDSEYTFRTGSTAQTITIAGGKTYGSISDFKAAVQSAIDGNAELKGKITVDVSDDGNGLKFLSSDGNLTVSQSNFAGSLFGAAGDATLTQGTDLVMDATVGGTETPIERSTNSFVLDGLTMTVTGTTSEGSAPIQFTASNDVDGLYQKISDFVDAYNKIIDKAYTYTSQTPYGLNSEAGTNDRYDPLTDDQKKEMTDDEIKEWNEKAQQGLLQNDNALNTLLRSLSSGMENAVESVGLSLSDIGISTAAYDYKSGGKLVIDKTKLQNALQSEPEKVSELFTNTDGVASRVKDVITQNIGIYGNSGTLVELAGSSTQIGVDNSQLGLQISDYSQTITKLQTQLLTEQDRWQVKFTNMETVLNTLTAQYDYLSSMTSSGS